MKILLDITHPADVHCSKNFIRIMRAKGHEILITARNRYPVFDLLDSLGEKYISRGKGAKSKIGKLFYMIYGNYKIYFAARTFKPDLFLCYMSPYAPQVSKLFSKPCIIFDDTEHAKLHRKFTFPFCDVILTPNCYSSSIGAKHIRFNSNLELNYLHPKYFTADKSILQKLNLNKNETFVILRFVSWNTHHSYNHKGINLKLKRLAVKEFSKYAKVFISSEDPLPEDLKKYKIKIPSDKMHDVLSFASLFYGESATMASESACLGTPAIYIDFHKRCYTDEEEKKYGLVFNYSTSINEQKKAIEKGIELLKNKNIKLEWKKRAEKMVSEKINLTDFMVWFIENYPRSFTIMKKNPDYQQFHN